MSTAPTATPFFIEAAGKPTSNVVPKRGGQFWTPIRGQYSKPVDIQTNRATSGNASTVQWSTNFEPVGAPEADVVRSLSDFYQAGFDNLKKLLSRPEATE